MQENKKDILSRIKEFPEVKPSEDFNERVLERIRQIKEKEETGSGIENKKSDSGFLMGFFNKWKAGYLIPAFGVILIIVLIYLFTRKDNEINKISEKKTSPEINLEKPRSVLAENDMKLLDSLLRQQKLLFDSAAKDIDMTIRNFTENNGKNFVKIFAEIYDVNPLKSDTLDIKGIQNAGIGSELDKALKNKIEQLDSKSVEILVEDLKKKLK